MRSRLSCFEYRNSLPEIKSRKAAGGEGYFVAKTKCHSKFWLTRRALSGTTCRLPAPLWLIYTFASLKLVIGPGANCLHAQTYVPTQPPSPFEDSWISNAYENQERTRGSFPSSRQGPQARLGKARISRVVSALGINCGLQASGRSRCLVLSLREADVAEKSATERRAKELGTGRQARFPKAARLLKHADFERVYSRGRRSFAAHMTFFYVPRQPGEGLRVGFTVSRALGGAVQRNRMRRRLREAVRLQWPGSALAADVVINPKKSLLQAEFEDLQGEVSRAFAVIGKSLEK